MTEKKLTVVAFSKNHSKNILVQMTEKKATSVVVFQKKYTYVAYLKLPKLLLFYIPMLIMETILSWFFVHAKITVTQKNSCFCYVFAGCLVWI